MYTDLIIVSEYCSKCDIEASFIELLAEEGLIEIQLVKGMQYFPASQLPDVERYTRWHYDLSINVEGIDAIRHLLTQIKAMHEELRLLKRQVAAMSGEA